jgi:hypothetical protein
MASREPDPPNESDETQRQSWIDPSQATATNDLGDVARQLVDMVGASQAARFLDGAQAPVPDWVVDQLGALAASDPAIPPVEDFLRGNRQFAALAGDIEDELRDGIDPDPSP